MAWSTKHGCRPAGAYDLIESAGPRAHRRVNRRSGTNHMSATATKMPYEIQGLAKARPTAAAYSTSDRYPLMSDPMALASRDSRPFA